MAIHKAKYGRHTLPECRTKVKEALKSASLKHNDVFGRGANGMMRRHAEVVAFRRQLWRELSMTYSITVIAEACGVDRHLLYQTLIKLAMEKTR